MCLCDCLTQHINPLSHHSMVGETKMKKVLKRYSRVVTLVLLVLALSMVTVQGVGGDYPVVISVGSADRVMFAPHTSSLADGNWIRLSGGMTVDLPSISFVYDGPDITYGRSGVTLKMYQSLIPDLTYPLDTHQVYKKGDSVTAEFLGESALGEKTVSFMLLQLSSLSEIKDVLDEGFLGAMATLLDSLVLIQPITLDSTGDGTYSFKAPNAGDYILVVAEIDIRFPNLSDSKIYIYSATPVEVVDYTLSVSVDSTVEKGDTLNVISTLDTSSDSYTHVVAMIKKSEYSANIILETAGSIPSTNLYLNGEIMAEGDLFTDFYTGIMDQSDLTVALIEEKLMTAFGSIAFGHTPATQTGTISLSTSSLST
ncbi:MAG TPA: TIGR04279 domain-containing protein, partial [bacterium]|nr:TIGR04279 domain-containing protein [bacterium]